MGQSLYGDLSPAWSGGQWYTHGPPDLWSLMRQPAAKARFSIATPLGLLNVSLLILLVVVIPRLAGDRLLKFLAGSGWEGVFSVWACRARTALSWACPVLDT